VNLRRLKYFIKIVDIGSLTQAAEVLFIAQPALSQQIVILEGEVGKQLLLRTKRGVTPTEAGRVLYRHAQQIQRQIEQAHADVHASGLALTGQVSVGLASGTAASALALPLLKTVRERHPEVVLYLNESLGSMLCEQVSNGRMDMAVLYGGRGLVQGLSFEPLLTEELVLVAPAERFGARQTITLAELKQVDLLLPRAQIESAATMLAAVASNVGATVLPASAAQAVAASVDACICRIVEPRIEVPLALCTSTRLPLTEPAQAVREIVLALVASLAQSGELGAGAGADAEAGGRALAEA